MFFNVHDTMSFNYLLTINKKKKYSLYFDKIGIKQTLSYS